MIFNASALAAGPIPAGWVPDILMFPSGWKGVNKMTDTANPDILYTIVDEAPELASASLLPIIRSFAKAADVSVGTKDISLAGRIIATFPEYLTEDQRQ